MDLETHSSLDYSAPLAAHPLTRPLRRPLRPRCRPRQPPATRSARPKLADPWRPLPLSRFPGRHRQLHRRQQLRYRLLRRLLALHHLYTLQRLPLLRPRPPRLRRQLRQPWQPYPSLLRRPWRFLQLRRLSPTHSP